MAIINIFSKRRKQLRGEVPDILTYDTLPKALRVQIVHIIKDAFGTSKGNYYQPNQPLLAFEAINKILCKEYGVFTLGKSYKESHMDSVLSFLLQTPNIEQAMDVIELSFQHINSLVSGKKS